MCSILSNRKQSRLSSFIDLRFYASNTFLLIHEEFITLNTHHVNIKSVVNQLKVLQSCQNSNYRANKSLCHIRLLRYILSLRGKFHISASNRFLAKAIKLLVPENFRMDSTFSFYDLQSTAAGSIMTRLFPNLKASGTSLSIRNVSDIDYTTLSVTKWLYSNDIIFKQCLVKIIQLVQKLKR
jgi:hypothetical protein